MLWCDGRILLACVGDVDGGGDILFVDLWSVVVALEGVVDMMMKAAMTGRRDDEHLLMCLFFIRVVIDSLA